MWPLPLPFLRVSVRILHENEVKASEQVAGDLLAGQLLP
jgi:hypothetical protein